MYADPKHIRQHRVSMSLTDTERRALELMAEINGIQPAVLARDMVIEFLNARITVDSAQLPAQLRAAH